MKILKKSATVLAQSAILTFVAVVGSSCDAETPAKASNVKVTPDTVAGDSISLSHIGNNWTGAAQAESTTASAFVVPLNYGHVKLWYWNHDSEPVTVSVKHVGSGYVYVNKVLAANEQFILRSTTNYPQGMSSGTYTVTYHSAAGNVNVEHSGFASDNKDEVESKKDHGVGK